MKFIKEYSDVIAEKKISIKKIEEHLVSIVGLIRYRASRM